MLITLCYSVLTWIQSRHRQEVSSWVKDCCCEQKSSLVFLRDGGPMCEESSSRSYSREGTQSRGYSQERNESVNSVAVSRSESTCSNFSTPKREYQRNVVTFHGSTNSLKQTTDLCYNSTRIRWQRLLWEEDRSKVLALFPLQIVELHDWTAFIGTKILEKLYEDDTEDQRQFYILIEAEPGAVQTEHYRKFGKITAWKCGAELALILLSDRSQLVDLMHIYRLGQIILDGGWRIFRLTTVACEGTIGTLISKPEVSVENNSTLTPGDLHRLAAGIYENRETPCGTPTSSLSKEPSKHDIATIEEVSPEENGDVIKKLPNWYDRSPKNKSISVTVTNTEKLLGRRRVGSFCSGTLSSKSSSLASLLLCSKSISVDEETVSSNPLCTTQNIKRNKATQRQSFENLVSPPPGHKSEAGSRVQSPGTENLPILPGVGVPKDFKSYSVVSSPKKTSGFSNTVNPRTPKRLGKPPNILVLCDDSKKRGEIAEILKSMLTNDRYAIYDIRWEQLAVGGWADQTALLVLSGKVPNHTEHIPILLQFLGDGGHLFAWGCESPPFGPTESNSFEVENRSSVSEKNKFVLNYGSSQTHPVSVMKTLWGPVKESNLPSGFPRILETNDFEGYSRPLTASVYAKVKESGGVAIIIYDGGALGGRAVLSRVCFEDTKDEESSLALLSVLLSQSLGIDCTRITAPEYTCGYLLGDHLKVKDFLADLPSVLQQSDVTIEFVPRGTKGSKPSHERFPVKLLECPANFSTLDYYNNLTTKELGRLVIYTDVITSTMRAFQGHNLKHGLVVVANRQTCGKGRGKNIWLSPEGCACFTFQINVALDSQLGRRLPLIQHIAAMAVVLAIPNHKEVSLRMKWPNDIYIEGEKVGGILVDTRIQGNTAIVLIGIGINVSNDHPTLSLNSVVGEGNKLTPATLVAKCLSQMEVLLDQIETGGLNQILNTYTENWLHTEQGNEDGVVRVEVSGGNYAECRIEGIDEFGFLRVFDINSGHVFSVQPDGNSFDIANRLIAIKT